MAHRHIAVRQVLHCRRRVRFDVPFIKNITAVNRSGISRLGSFCNMSLSHRPASDLSPSSPIAHKHCCFEFICSVPAAKDIIIPDPTSASEWYRS
ncbi:uncharacterized [Tachysurus ichikawai]